MDRIYPNLFIVGAPKCGTSSLYHYLRQHPEIYMSPFKEPHFIIAEELKFIENHKWITNQEDYFDLFNEAETYKIRGEASSFYLYYHKTAIPGIKSIVQETPYILIILRNPVQRIISAYKHMVRTNIKETFSFEQIVRTEEENRPINHPMMLYKAMGKYADMVEEYQNNFKRVKVIIYEEFFQDIRKNIIDVWKYLNVDPELEINYDKKWNVKNYQWKSRSLQKLFITNNIFKKTARQIAPFLQSRYIKNKIKAMTTKSVTLNIKDESIEYLMDFYKADIQKLSDLLDKDLSYWMISSNIRKK